MSENTQADEALASVDTSIEKQINTILPGSDPLSGLEARHEGGLEYTVISVRDGAPSIHWVTLGETPTCTCADYKGNRKRSFTEDFGDREPCSHIVKAYLSDRMSPEDMALQELINVTAVVSQASQEAREAAAEARDTARELDTGLTRVRDAQAGSASQTGSNTGNQTASDTSNSGSHSNEQEASDAADRLQEAFDNVVEGMAVEHNEGVVWVNKTPDAPETLPGPGNVEIFSVFLQNPEQMEYVHDDHDYAGAEPGQYFGNMIRPENVDEYISEVLE